MKPKRKPKCKHNWSKIKFDSNGYPLSVDHSWRYLVTERCLTCNLEHERNASYQDVVDEINVKICQTCSYELSDHKDGNCVNLLSSKIYDLERRLENIESWRYGD